MKEEDVIVKAPLASFTSTHMVPEQAGFHGLLMTRYSLPVIWTL